MYARFSLGAPTERSALGSDVEDGGDAQMLRVVLLVEHSHQKHTQWCAEGNVKM